MCLKTCHCTVCWMSLYTSAFWFFMWILHVTSSLFCLYLLNIYHLTHMLNIYHLTHTFSCAHTKARTQRHTCIISTQEEWRQPDTGAWLRGAEEWLFLETKALHTQKNIRKTRYSRIQRKGFEHTAWASSKATRPWDARTCEANHWEIVGEHRAQCASEEKNFSKSLVPD